MIFTMGLGSLMSLAISAPRTAWSIPWDLHLPRSCRRLPTSTRSISAPHFLAILTARSETARQCLTTCSSQPCDRSSSMHSSLLGSFLAAAFPPVNYCLPPWIGDYPHPALEVLLQLLATRMPVKEY